MATKIQLRHDTSAAWGLADPILAEGEMGIETDTQRSKLGNGEDNWSALPYMADTNFAGNYVAKLGDDTAQVITGTGGLKTDGLLETAGAIKVSGGPGATDLDGCGITSAGAGGLRVFNQNKPILNAVNSDGSTVLFDNTADNYSFMQLVGSSGDLKLSALNVERLRFTPTSTGQDIRFTVFHDHKDLANNNSVGLSVNANLNGINDSSRKAQIFRANVNVDATTLFDSASVFVATGPFNQPADKIKEYYGFSAQASVATASASDHAYGFHSNLGKNSDKNFNFYAKENAPNFFAGDTYIGGTVCRRYL